MVLKAPLGAFLLQYTNGSCFFLWVLQISACFFCVPGIASFTTYSSTTAAATVAIDRCLLHMYVAVETHIDTAAVPVANSEVPMPFTARARVLLHLLSATFRCFELFCYLSYIACSINNSVTLN